MYKWIGTHSNLILYKWTFCFGSYWRCHTSPKLPWNKVVFKQCHCIPLYSLFNNNSRNDLYCNNTRNRKRQTTMKSNFRCYIPKIYSYYTFDINQLTCETVSSYQWVSSWVDLVVFWKNTGASPSALLWTKLSKDVLLDDFKIRNGNPGCLLWEILKA